MAVPPGGIEDLAARMEEYAQAQATTMGRLEQAVAATAAATQALTSQAVATESKLDTGDTHFQEAMHQLTAALEEVSRRSEEAGQAVEQRLVASENKMAEALTAISNVMINIQAGQATVVPAPTRSLPATPPAAYG